MASTDGFIQQPYGSIAFKEWGSKRNPKVLAVHGWLDNSASFDRLASRLQDSFHIVAVDLPGHGHSDGRPGLYSYNFCDWIIDLQVTLQHLGWQDYVLLGHSMGAGVGMLFVASTKTPPRCFWGFDSLAPMAKEPSSVPTDLSKFLERNLAAVGRERRPRHFIVEQLVAKRSSIDPTTPTSALEAICRRHLTDDGLYLPDPRLSLPSAVRLTPAQVGATLATIKLPCHFVLGQNSPYFERLQHGRATLAKYANMHFYELKTGHYPHWEEAGTCAAMITGT